MAPFAPENSSDQTNLGPAVVLVTAADDVAVLDVRAVLGVTGGGAAVEGDDDVAVVVGRRLDVGEISEIVVPGRLLVGSPAQAVTPNRPAVIRAAVRRMFRMCTSLCWRCLRRKDLELRRPGLCHRRR